MNDKNKHTPILLESSSVNPFSQADILHHVKSALSLPFLKIIRLLLLFSLTDKTEILLKKLMTYKDEAFRN